MDELAQYNSWVRRQDYEKVITIPGNHDILLQHNPMLARNILKDTVVLIDEPYELRGVLIWGSPWVPKYKGWAFGLDRGVELAEKWSKIHPNTDLLVTHGPPYGMGDRTNRYSERAGMVTGVDNIGCVDLLRRVEQVRPKWHLFGHVHDAYGIYRKEGLSTVFINAAICSPYKPRQPYEHINPAVVIDTETGEVTQEPFSNRALADKD